VDVYTLNTRLFRPIPESGPSRTQRICTYYYIPSISVFRWSVIIYCRSLQPASETIHNVIIVEKKTTIVIRQEYLLYSITVMHGYKTDDLSDVCLFLFELCNHFSSFFFTITVMLMSLYIIVIQGLYSISFYSSGTIKINNRHLIEFTIIQWILDNSNIYKSNFQ